MEHDKVFISLALCGFKLQMLHIFNMSVSSGTGRSGTQVSDL